MANTFSFTDFIDFYGRTREATDQCARYTGVCASAPHVLHDLLPRGFEERSECCRFPDRVVWADDTELGLVVWTPIMEDGQAGRLTMEVWGSDKAYHARLDDLAELPV